MNQPISRLGRIIFFCLILGGLLSAQTTRVTISGFAHDDTNGEALIGANVFIQELGIGASTNISGYFVIPNVPAGDYVLSCSYIGFQTLTVRHSAIKDCDGCITFNMKPESIETEEVVVTADSVETIQKLFSKPVSKIELSPAQIQQIPRVVEADLLRALQTMPGIVAVSDFSSALYVRGGTPDQNLYMIDGTDVYNPEHAFGIFSTFNTSAIKKVEISKGAFGAEYGGRLSSVLDVTNNDGNRKNFQGETNVSLLAASTTLQMPIGNIGSISGSFRRTYIDLTVKNIIDGIPDYYFYDGNVKAFFDLGKKDKLTISFFRGLDDLTFKADEDAASSFEFLYDWGNITTSINWKHIFNPTLFASVWFTGSRFESKFNLDAVEISEENYLSDYAAKVAFEYYPLQELTFRFGAEQKLLHEKYDQNSSEARILIENNRQFSTAYLSAIWKPKPVWQIDAGLRVNYFGADTVFTNFEPRFSIKYRLDENSNIKFATGYYHQYINQIPRLFFSSIWSTANKYNSESSSKHFILGYQRAFGKLELELETYYKDYKNIYQFNNHVGTDIKPSYYSDEGLPVYGSTENVFIAGDGYSYGAEIMLRKNHGAFTGWVSYAYAHTEYKFPRLNQGSDFAPRHDRNSVVNAVLNVDLDNALNELYGEQFVNDDSRWVLGLNFIYADGQPITTPSSAYLVNSMPDYGRYGNTGNGSQEFTLYPAEINSFRLPAYIRMDVSLTWELDYGSWQMAPYLQVFNIGNRSNIWFVQYNSEVNENNSIKQEVETVGMLPLLPSIGVTIKF